MKSSIDLIQALLDADLEVTLCPTLDDPPQMTVRIGQGFPVRRPKLFDALVRALELMREETGLDLLEEAPDVLR